MKVALGVTGCIGAYKAVEVLRGLQKTGVSVEVVMTRNAANFIVPRTFQAISRNPDVSEMFAPTDAPHIKHISLAQEIELLVIAPATANILAKMAHGIADDFLSTLYISTTAPVLVAPAMNAEMWRHPATQANVRILRERGVEFVDPEDGYLACRTVGPGRLAEPAKIVERAVGIMAERISPASSRRGAGTRDLLGERVLITAGPTYEAIDPVRGITNRSSGRMGYAVADAALDRGAAVTLVTGPVKFDPPARANTVRVRSAAEMLEAVRAGMMSATAFVMAAAVADYRPVQSNNQKIKKNAGNLVLELERTEDILAEVCRTKGDRIVVGFAAETENVIVNARAKLVAKGCDLIVANDVSADDAGFDVPTNIVTLVSVDETTELPLMSKREAADRILNEIVKLQKASSAVA